MTLAAERLVDWRTAVAVGERVTGAGLALSPVERARLSEDFAQVVPEAESMVIAFTGLSPNGYRSRPWVMTRAEWLRANLRGFERILEPFAQKVLSSRSETAFATVRRVTLGAQAGALLGYLGHKVLGQYDLFLPPDDDGTIYFIGANVIGVERRYRFPARDFRMWLSLHEVAHRLQFGGVPWLRSYVTGLMDSYLSSLELDPKRLLETVRHAVEEVRSGRVEWRGMGWVFLLMTPDQRGLFQRMQAMMSLLEGHGNFVMDQVARRHIGGAEVFKRRLHERRTRAGVEKAFQKAIGLDVKVRQYAEGERFVAAVVEQVGMDGFNRIWERPDNLPTLEEIGHPADWVARVAS